MFADVPPGVRDWWIVIVRDGVDVCDADPGFDVRVTIETDLRTMTLVWRGDVSWSDALRSGRLVVRGESLAQRALPRWLKLSGFARTPRPAPEARAG